MANDRLLDQVNSFFYQLFICLILKPHLRASDQYLGCNILCNNVVYSFVLHNLHILIFIVLVNNTFDE